MTVHPFSLGLDELKKVWNPNNSTSKNNPDLSIKPDDNTSSIAINPSTTITQAFGEGGSVGIFDPPQWPGINTTMAVGEEGGGNIYGDPLFDPPIFDPPIMTTMAVGEEGGSFYPGIIQSDYCSDLFTGYNKYFPNKDKYFSQPKSPRITEMSDNNYFGKNNREWVLGNDNDNIISGRGGDDILIGAQGNDTILGGVGKDILNGAVYCDVEAGKVGDGELDILKGGQGKDLFVAADKYNGNYYCGEGSEDYMLVQDFSLKQQDKLQLTGSKRLYYTKEEYIAGSSRADIGIYEKSSGDLMCVLQDIGNSSPALRSAGGGKLDLDKIAVFV